MGNIELYTRPGCPFCFALRRRLRKLGIECLETNIWNDPEARDRVRAVANGNETVPTFHIGDGGWSTRRSRTSPHRFAGSPPATAQWLFITTTTTVGMTE